ncbi:MAG: hypothetical protein JWN87_2936 [Frankiales bacterium]|nr:hypothetical protein [Frankiales bacterium]
MIVAGEVLFLVQLCLLVYCVLNVVTTPEGECRNLPKLVWLVLVVLLPIAGGIAWLVAGRPVGRRPRTRTTTRSSWPSSRPGRSSSARTTLPSRPAGCASRRTRPRPPDARQA